MRGGPMRAEAGCGAGRCERRQGAGRADASGGRVRGGPMLAEAGCGAGRCERRQDAGRAYASGGRVRGGPTWQCERRQGAGLLAESDVVRAVMEGSLAKADDVCGC